MQSTGRRLFRTNGVEIDSESGRITRNGEVVFLRQKAQRVLLCLLEQRDQPVPKDDLIRRVWDGGGVGDEVLTGCIREIRKALGDDARQPVFIRTMPKNGYWFVAPVEESMAAAAESAPSLPEPEPPSVTLPPEPDPQPRRSPRPWALAGAAAAAIAGAMLWAKWPVEPRVTLEEAAWWRLDEGKGASISDSVQGRSAAVPPDVRWTAGLRGTALAFDGRETSVSGEDTHGLPRGDAPRTTMAWIKANGAPADSTVFFKYGAPGPSTHYDSFGMLLHQSGRAWFGHHLWFALGNSRIDDGNWRHVAGVFDGREAVLFVDGVRQSARAVDKDHLKRDDRTVWSIGRADWGGTPYRGAVDDIRVFSRPLRAAEIHAIYRCASPSGDLEISGLGTHFLSPVFGMDVEIAKAAEGEHSFRMRNAGKDYAGAAFARSGSDCAWRDTLAAGVGQDLDIELEIRPGGRPEGPVASAGPYFRSRRSTPGDGIVGGTSAGFWVELLSTGQVRVKRLNPVATVAFSSPGPGFDPDRFHSLRVSVRGPALEASLDGNPLAFDQGGSSTARVELQPLWESATPPGRNQGAAGIAFSSEGYRNQIGGQEVRNVRIAARGESSALR